MSDSSLDGGSQSKDENPFKHVWIHSYFGEAQWTFTSLLSSGTRASAFSCLLSQESKQGWPLVHPWMGDQMGVVGVLEGQ